MKLKNLILAFKDQLPIRRMYVNFLVTRNAWGLFSKFSHERKDGTAKVQYNSRASALRAAESMQKKHEGKFRPYKCIFCDGYHVGKNRV